MSVITKTTRDDYRALLRLADRLSPSLRHAFLQALANATLGIDVAAVIEAVTHGHYARLGELLSLEPMVPELREPAQRVSQSAFMGGAVIGHQLLPESARVAVSFDLVNPEAVRFARERAGALVTNVTSENRPAIATIRELVTTSQSGGMTVRELEHELRPLIRSTLGLTEGQTQAVHNYFDRLTQQGRGPNDRLETIGPQEVLRMTGRYAEGLVKYRAEMIARTETLTAANSGQTAMWDEAARQGYLVKSQTWKEWLVTPDDRLCPYCESLDGQRVLLDDQFQDDEGQFEPVDNPPLHPACRCAIGLAFSNESED